MSMHSEAGRSTFGGNLRIGLPSARSRLYRKVALLLNLNAERCQRQLVFRSQEAAVFFLRPWDLPTLVAKGMLDVAICGLDTIMELDADVVIHERFEGMRSPIALCVREPAGARVSGGGPIVVSTEYPKISREFLSKHDMAFEIHEIRGAAEAFPYLDGVTSIVDVVETGQTLAANGLRISEVVTYTCPCVIRRKDLNTEETDLRIENLSQLVSEALK